ncbi:hypothetical protein [uncultured Shimia sp.]|uniref:hypothetical protein n=1 Tax=uncultured Shimia sp. TaxID=573152 RepID=UPI0026194586|nr:hypothetical protein [uncultured Shimia sp.]
MKSTIATLALMALFPASGALANNWVCTFPNQQLDGWLRGQVFVTTSGEEATVFDSLINQEHGEAIAARIPTNNEARMTLKWDLKRVELRHSYAPRIRYTMTVVKDTGRATFTGSAPELQDYRNSSRAGGNFNARGSCKRK